MPTLTALCGESTGRTARAIDKVLAHADCQSAIQPIDNRRYSVAQTGSLLYRRLLTGYGCATICANFVNGPAAGASEAFILLPARLGFASLPAHQEAARRHSLENAF